MTTVTVANRLIELCGNGNFIQAQHELYDKDIKSIDPDGSVTVGALNRNAKEQRFLDNLEKIYYNGPLCSNTSLRDGD